MLETLRSDLSILRAGTPGRRFREFRLYKRKKRSRKKPIARILTFVTGILLVIAGLAIGWIPGPGGFIGIIGLAMLAREIPGVAVLMDYCELVMRLVWSRFRGWPWWLQILMATVAAVILGTTTWLGYRLLF